MKVRVKQLVVGAMLALAIGAAGAATAATKAKLPPPPLDPCAINYQRCISSGLYSTAICAMKEQACRSAGLGRIGANTESPAQTLKDLSPDAEFHAAQFQSLIASSKTAAASATVKAGLTPAQCYQLYKACNNWRGSISKCIQFEAKCSSP